MTRTRQIRINSGTFTEVVRDRRWGCVLVSWAAMTKYHKLDNLTTEIYSSQL